MVEKGDGDGGLTYYSLIVPHLACLSEACVKYVA